MPPQSPLVDAHNDLVKDLKDPKAFEAHYVFREGGASSELADRILMDRGHRKHILTGLRGCGRTTELLALCRALQETHIAVYISVLDDAHTANVTYGHLLLIETVALLDRLRMPGLEKAEPKAREVAQWLVATLPELPKAGGGGGGGGGAEPVANAVRSVRAVLKAPRARDAVAARIEEHHAALVERLDNLIKAIETASGKKVLMAVDDLDKMDTSHAAMLFRDHHMEVTSPACACVLSVPYLTVISPEFRRVRGSYGYMAFQGPVQVAPSSTDARGEARGLLHDIVVKRIDAAKVKGDALASAMEMSGGVTATLLRILSEACIPQAGALVQPTGDYAVTIHDVDAAMGAMATELRRTLSREEMDALLELKAGRRKGLDPVVASLLRDGYVLEYPERQGTFVPVPLLATVL